MEERSKNELVHFYLLSGVPAKGFPYDGISSASKRMQGIVPEFLDYSISGTYFIGGIQ